MSKIINTGKMELAELFEKEKEKYYESNVHELKKYLEKREYEYYELHFTNSVGLRVSLNMIKDGVQNVCVEEVENEFRLLINRASDSIIVPLQKEIFYKDTKDEQSSFFIKDVCFRKWTMSCAQPFMSIELTCAEIK